jgi:hypothetical protein
MKASIMKDVRMGSVYEIKTPLGSYVGSTINSSFARWVTHMAKLKKGIHHCLELQKAWNKFGITQFSFFIIEVNISPDDLFEREIFWIKYKKSFSSERTGRKITKRSLIEGIIHCLKKGITYRNIKKKYNISLGAISNIKTRHVNK